MATTKILPVRKRLKDCLDYAANPKKTEIFRGDALDRLMHTTPRTRTRRNTSSMSPALTATRKTPA